MYTDKECPAGHYCLQGTTISTNFPCPGGTYYAGTGATDEAFCLDCPEGHYCIEVMFARNIYMYMHMYMYNDCTSFGT